MPTALNTGTKYYWRVRPEADDQAGSWSATVAFTTTGTVVPPPRSTSPARSARITRRAGQTLPLPDMRGELAKFSNASDSCPQGIKYVLNPWLNRVIDHFRTFDTRWGYNAKPTKTAADNNGVPVVAAGDEAAYNPTRWPTRATPARCWSTCSCSTAARRHDRLARVHG